MLEEASSNCFSVSVSNRIASSLSSLIVSGWCCNRWYLYHVMNGRDYNSNQFGSVWITEDHINRDVINVPSHVSLDPPKREVPPSTFWSFKDFKHFREGNDSLIKGWSIDGSSDFVKSCSMVLLNLNRWMFD